MRLSDFRDYFRLKPFLSEPWAFLSRASSGPDGEEIPFRDGFTFHVRNVPMDRHIFHRVFARDEYRLNGTALGSWGDVVDVGAHIGIFAARVAPIARRVFCYEPMKENFETLERNMKHPRFSHVRLFQKAVAGRAGRLPIFPSDNPSAHSMFPAKAPDATAVEIEAVTLAEVFAGNAIETCDLLKLDCEGAEYEIFGSMPADLWPRIRRIRMEYHPVAGDAGATVERLSRLLDERGYRREVVPSKKTPDKGHIFAVLR